MNRNDAFLRSRELMELADAAYLTTIDTEGFPQTRAMLNLRNRV